MGLCGGEATVVMVLEERDFTASVCVCVCSDFMKKKKNDTFIVFQFRIH